MEVKKSNTKSTVAMGKIGEDVTKKHLLIKNFGFIEQNYRKKCGEIDLIMKYKNKIMFFEVKTVSREIFKLPFTDISRETGNGCGDQYRAEDNVHPSKLKKISKTIKLWMEENGVLESIDWAFNVAVVYFSRNQKKFYIKYIWDVIL